LKAKKNILLKLQSSINSISKPQNAIALVKVKFYGINIM